MNATPPAKTEATELMDAILAAAGDFLREIPATHGDEPRALPTASVSDHATERPSQGASPVADQTRVAKEPE